MHRVMYPVFDEDSMYVEKEHRGIVLIAPS